MISKRILPLVLALGLAAGVACPALAAQVECDSIYCFSDRDFSEVEGLTGVCITGLPDPSAGTVMLGSRVIRAGDILNAAQVEKLTFHPLRTELDRTVTVTYLPIYQNRVAPAATMTIAIHGKQDKAPVAQDGALETYKNLPNGGKLNASDPEGEALTFTLVRAPKRGEVTIYEDGSYTYSPKKNKVGTDSFTYTVTDPAGNVSRTATVTVEILKPKDKNQYTDTLGQTCRFEAEWLKNTGIFVGETISGKSCFQPEKTVSRGEFLAMLVNSLDMKVDADAVETGFTDLLPTWLKPYLAAARSMGLLKNWPHGEVFGDEAPITGAEAALLVQNALSLPQAETPVWSGEEQVPAWAQEAMAALSAGGMTLPPNAVLTRSHVALLLYKVAQSR